MILVIDNYDSFVYNLVHYVEDFGVRAEVVRNDALTVADVLKKKPKAVILSPGSRRTAERSRHLLRASRKGARRSADVWRVLGPPGDGSCLRRRCRRGAGDHARQSVEVTHHDRGLFRGLPSPFRATRYHSLAVKRATFPAELNIDAETADGEVMGLSHKTRPIFGVQFHPESIASEHGHAIVGNFLDAAGLR